MDTERVASLDYFQGMQRQEIEVIAGAMKEDRPVGRVGRGSARRPEGKASTSYWKVIFRVERRQDNGEIVTVGMLGVGAIFGILGVLDGARAASCGRRNGALHHGPEGLH